MTGVFLSLHRGPLPPFAWRSWCPRSVHRLLAASPCHGLSPSPSTLSQSDCPGVIRASSLCPLVRPFKPRLHPWALPCSHTIRGTPAVGTHPGSTRSSLALAAAVLLPSPQGAAGRLLPTRSISGLLLPFTDVPASVLPVYASSGTLPCPTQDSVPDCWLRFVRAAIADGWTVCACKAQPRTDPGVRHDRTGRLPRGVPHKRCAGYGGIMGGSSSHGVASRSLRCQGRRWR